MATIEAVPTDALLDLLGDFLVGDVPMGNPFEIDTFKVGEGGWRDTPGGRVPRVPDSSLTDLDVIDNPSRYPSDSQGSFSKALTPGTDTVKTTASGVVTVAADCLLDTGDFNDDGNGNFPEIYEIGLFGPHPITASQFMIAYGTFERQEKTPDGSILNTVTLKFQVG